MLSFVESPRRLLTAHNIINGLSSKIRELDNKLNCNSTHEYPN